MKKVKTLAIVLAMVMLLGVCLSACNNDGDYTITLNMDKSHLLEQDSQVDFTQFFNVKDRDGNVVTVTNDMLDLSKVDLSQVGNTFKVTLTIGKATKSATFIVVEKTSSGQKPGGDDDQQQGNATDLSKVFANYTNVSSWNFADTVTITYDGETSSETYKYKGYDIQYAYDYDGDSFTDYLGYDAENDRMIYYSDDGYGNYEAYAEDSTMYEIYVSFIYFIYLDALVNQTFTQSGDHFVASNPNACGKAAIYDWGDGTTWTSFDLYVNSSNQITKIVAKMSDGYVEEHSFSQYGKVNFTLPNVTPDDNADDDVEYDDANSVDLQKVLAKYTNNATWNFAVTVKDSYYGDSYAEHYEYNGYNISNSYVYEGVNYTEYIGYDVESDTFYFYYDNGDGSYTKYAEGTDDFNNNIGNLYLISPDSLAEFSFTASGNKFVANNPSACGNAVIGEYEDATWTSIELYVANDQIAKIVAVSDGGWTETYIFSNYGQITFTLPDDTSSGDSGSGSGGNTTPSGVMEKQTYNRDTFTRDDLQNKMTAYTGNYALPSIGLPSNGTYSALVIPVQFKGDTITSTQLGYLEKAFNGDGSDTGWESVTSYYQKSSYGALNLSFDIKTVYQAKNSSSYYKNQKYGEELILEEVLAHYEGIINLADYDTNRDGYIDAVYLIYSAPVDYDNADFYWAYVTWYEGKETYDGVRANYYLFAGFDFMDESTTRDAGSGYSKIDGLKINASTFIHESGHLLGLDDYYDYDETLGCNEGLGGADMMDYTVGDHNPYTKIMLGWLEPTIVNDTETVTIDSLQKTNATNARAILIPLNFNNSYFCEYLLVDLYTNDGLNALHAGADDSILYGGAAYGVRIYHVSSSINNPYSTDYFSFTDYNNTDTKYALIKLVEADGEKKFNSSEGYAAASDLWKTGKTLSNVFPNYTRNDGKKLCFDISMDSVSASSATITVTYNA